MSNISGRIDGKKLLLEVCLKAYDKRAVTAASYKFIDKAYIHIAPITGDSIEVYFVKKEATSESLSMIVDNFRNELLDQQIRLDVENRYGNIRELIVKYAFSPIENIEDEIKIDRL